MHFGGEFDKQAPGSKNVKGKVCFVFVSSTCEEKIMKKPANQFSPEAFEAVCNHWEQCVKEFVFQLSGGSIPALRNVEWTLQKKRVFVCEPDANGKKKRGACGPSFRSFTPLSRTAADAIWKIFKQFCMEHGLSSIQRLRNNEKELSRYDFRATNGISKDGVSCSIYLPGEWNKAAIRISVTIGPRYRNEDLSEF